MAIKLRKPIKIDPIDVLEKRIKAVKIALKLNPKNKKAQKQLKALEIVKRFPKNN